MTGVPSTNTSRRLLAAAVAVAAVRASSTARKPFNANPYYFFTFNKENIASFINIYITLYYKDFLVLRNQ